ncbi:MAG: ribokinase [Mesorhizobium sp.]|uniref:ribokinase n=1 Tax=Mesorhizobium sp. TaxID=1871066 RepID=UPI000FE2D87E|nr:ribokinase [Mesorhizobium sp.]RWB96856.1 MAG: ribokinase [Mesorhizobium sp.]RWO04461.1 MAG: ribokinase [Mesorhizobium sp.]RWO35810.1 MAG: ribokinase [Mesorhizobium sp.]RWP14128.1 MAG: ribokinase [Mesorhizobium sp.]RWP15843.1 MAG: ribokinase [Mesorhizobium sp.]
MIIVVGSINLDLIANVDRLPAPGETVRGSGFSTAPGGKGANQALAAARAGAKVRMVGAVGKDNFANEALALLRDGKIDLSGVGETFASTGTALIMVADDGENIIAVVPGANDSVVTGDLSKAFMKKGDVVLLQQEIPLQTVDAALDAARAAGAVTVLNTAPFRAEAAAFLGKADYVVANETEFDLYGEALSLSGRDRPARMRDFAGTTGRTIVVTLGGDGVLAATPADLLMVPALNVTPVDTVGAGDTFCGYFAAGLSSGLPLDQALARAAAAGSLACLKPGAQPAIPLAKDVEAALQNPLTR